MNGKICAVVVTHNRLRLLQECIGALRLQTKKLDEIIVVNNDSQDGTEEWLNVQEDLVVIHQENLGGAGGFHSGMKLAFEMDIDWIWCMDDDCLAEAYTLDNLYKSNEVSLVLNSVVVSKSNPEQLNFGLFDEKLKQEFTTYKEIKNKKIVYSANFFNGTLFHKTVIETVGLPNPNFFIYGELFFNE